MKDLEGNKIKAKTMTQDQAQQVLERMAEKASKKIHRRALEYALDAFTAPRNPRIRAAKA